MWAGGRARLDDSSAGNRPCTAFLPARITRRVRVVPVRWRESRQSVANRITVLDAGRSVCPHDFRRQARIVVHVDEILGNADPVEFPEGFPDKDVPYTAVRTCHIGGMTGTVLG